MTERVGATDAPPPPPPPPPPDDGPHDRKPDATPELSDALGDDDHDAQSSDAREPGGGAGQPQQADAPAAVTADAPAGPASPDAREQVPERDASPREPETPGLPRPDASDELRSAIAEPEAQRPGPSDDQGTRPGAANETPGSADTSGAVRDRKTWEVNPDSSELPQSMKEDLHELGRDLNEIAGSDDWAKGDIDTRREMLDTANDRIREEYGLPQRDVSYRSDLDPDCTGYYDSESGEIVMDSRLLEADHPEEAIRTLAHENFHDYQQQAMDGRPGDPYAQSRMGDWSEGDANYDSNDVEEYLANPLEADAFAVEDEVYRGYKGG